MRAAPDGRHHRRCRGCLEPPGDGQPPRRGRDAHRSRRINSR